MQEKKPDHFILQCTWNHTEQEVLVLSMQTQGGTVYYCRFINTYCQLKILTHHTADAEEWIDLFLGKATEESRFLGQQIDVYFAGKKAERQH